MVSDAASAFEVVLKVSHHPATVQRASTLGPNKASTASFIANSPARSGPRSLGYYCLTSSGGNSDSKSIASSDKGGHLLLLLLLKVIAVHWLSVLKFWFESLVFFYYLLGEKLLDTPGHLLLFLA